MFKYCHGDANNKKNLPGNKLFWPQESETTVHTYIHIYIHTDICTLQLNLTLTEHMFGIGSIRYVFFIFACVHAKLIMSNTCHSELSCTVCTRCVHDS